MFEDSRPVPDAILRLISKDKSTINATVADDCGRFNLYLENAVDGRLLAIAPGTLLWTSQDIERTTSSISLTIVIQIPSSLHLKVVGDDGRSLQAVVRVTSPTEWVESCPAEIRRGLSLLSGDDGAILIQGLPVTHKGSPLVVNGINCPNLSLLISHKGYYTASELVEILPGENRRVVVLKAAPPNLHICGVALNSDGTPAADTAVSWMYLRGPYRKGPGPAVCQTDSGGFFSFEIDSTQLQFHDAGDLDGVIRLKLRNSSSADSYADVIGIHGGQTIPELVVSLKSGVEVRGTVTDTDGDPIPGARIWFARQDEDAEVGCGEESVFADSAGNFRMILQSSGRYRAGATADGFIGDENGQGEDGISILEFDMPRLDLKLRLMKIPK